MEPHVFKQFELIASKELIASQGRESYITAMNMSLRTKERYMVFVQWVRKEILFMKFFFFFFK